MSSSEEYLDSLLKSLTESTGNTNMESISSAVQNPAEADKENGLQDISVPNNEASESANGMMSADEIEAMFAAMGEGTADEAALSEEPALTNDIMSNELALDEGMLSDELALDEGMLPDELALDEGMLSGELALDEGMLSDELVLDEGMLPDELALDEGMLPDELALDEGMLSDELTLDEGMLSGELALDEGMLPDELALDEGMSSDELVLDEGMPSDELALDEGILSDELVLDEGMLPDELTLDEGMLPDEMPLDEGMLSDELSLDEGMLSEVLSLGEESLTDDLALEELTAGDSASDELSLDELGLGDLGLDDLGLDDLGLEETAQTGGDMMLEEDTDSVTLPSDDFALEESSEDDADLSALLASMGGDEDLSEINDLLEKSDQGVAVDDDVMALLGDGADGEEGEDSFGFFSGEETEGEKSENIREMTPEELGARQDPKTKKQKKNEEKERKKREKQAKRAKRQNASQGTGTDAENSDDLDGQLDGLGEMEGKPEKQGFFAKLVNLLLEEDESDESDESDSGDVGLVIGNLSDENKELLAELSAEDKKNAKKKDKKDKKSKKGTKKASEAAEESGEGEEAEDKPKKPKKEKKKKKEKEKKVEEEPKVPEKKLSKKKVTSVFMFCATIAVCIVLVTMLLPEQMEKQEARVAFDHSQYTQVYELLYGKELSEEDEILLHKSSIILSMQRKLDSYENYTKMGMPLEALDALIEGVDRYQSLRDDAELYNVSGEVEDIYGQILDALAYNYSLSEADAMDIISSGDDVTYSQRIRDVISGNAFEGETEDQPKEKQDVLPEEEEIIDRLQGPETE